MMAHPGPANERQDSSLAGAVGRNVQPRQGKRGQAPSSLIESANTSRGSLNGPTVAAGDRGRSDGDEPVARKVNELATNCPELTNLDDAADAPRQLALA